MAAKIEQYIVETCKMQHSFAWTFRSCANRIFTQFLQYTALSTQVASHVAVMWKILQPSLWLKKVSNILQKLAKCSTALHGPLGVAPIDFLAQFLQYCSFHSDSDSCGSDEGSLQPSLWLPKLTSILQKLAKCSTALHLTSGVVPIEFFAQLLQYTALSTQPAIHVAVMREAYSHHYGCQS